jgi:hypothetical protein
MSMYFFHNVYGDEQGLLDTLPSGVIAVPFGWTPEAEENRNNIITSLGITVSAIPSLFVFIEEHYAHKSFIQDVLSKLQTDTDVRVNTDMHLVTARWTQFNLLDLPKPWSWDQILEVVANYHKL